MRKSRKDFEELTEVIISQELEVKNSNGIVLNSRIFMQLMVSLLFLVFWIIIFSWSKNIIFAPVMFSMGIELLWILYKNSILHKSRIVKKAERLGLPIGISFGVQQVSFGGSRYSMDFIIAEAVSEEASVEQPLLLLTTFGANILVMPLKGNKKEVNGKPVQTKFHGKYFKS